MLPLQYEVEGSSSPPCASHDGDHVTIPIVSTGLKDLAGDAASVICIFLLELTPMCS